MTNGDVKTKYDLIAPFYEDALAIRQLQQLDVLRAHLKKDRLNYPMIDVGAGTGLLKRYLGLECLSIDLSHGMLRQGFGPRICADWCTLPLRTGSIGTFFSISVLETDRDFARMLDEMARVLRPHGWFFLAVLKTEDLQQVERSLIKRPFSLIERHDAHDSILFIGQRIH